MRHSTTSSHAKTPTASRTPRFEQQLSFLEENSAVDVVGGYIEEVGEEMTEPICV